MLSILRCAALRCMAQHGTFWCQEAPVQVDLCGLFMKMVMPKSVGSVSGGCRWMLTWIESGFCFVGDRAGSGPGSSFGEWLCRVRGRLRIVVSPFSFLLKFYVKVDELL